MKNHFLDARSAVFELFWINASALSHSEPDLLANVVPWYLKKGKRVLSLNQVRN